MIVYFLFNEGEPAYVKAPAIVHMINQISIAS